MLISRLIEIVMCFPTFFLILALLSIITTRSILIIMLLIGLTGWTGIARLVRGEVLRQRSLDYVAAAVALGAGSGRIIFRHVLPNAVAPVLVSITFGVAGAILTESGLAFLGLGVDPTSTASWGELLYQAREGPLLHWWLVLFPGFAIFFTVTTYNLVGEGLRDAMDPRLRENG
jgi:peptide/nickel transport system permease protein